MEKTETNNLQFQKNSIKFSSIIIMISLTFLGCTNKSKETIYKYNSVEYNIKIKEFKIPVAKASSMASLLYFEFYPNSKEYNFTLDFILDDYYIFCSPTRLYNLKTTKYFLSGIWVNGKTGEVIKKDVDKYVKVIIPLPSTNSSCYSKTIKNPKLTEQTMKKNIAP